MPVTTREAFLKQTAEDYDMDYEDVLQISKTNPDDFYQALEDFIAARTKENEDPNSPKV